MTLSATKAKPNSIGFQPFGKDTEARNLLREQEVGSGSALLFSTSSWASHRRLEIVTIQALGPYSLVFPLYVTVEEGADDYIARSADLELVGLGDSEVTALEDLRDQITELYDALRSDRQNLGPLMAQKLAFLDKLAGELLNASNGERVRQDLPKAQDETAGRQG